MISIILSVIAGILIVGIYAEIQSNKENARREKLINHICSYGKYSKEVQEFREGLGLTRNGDDWK